MVCAAGNSGAWGKYHVQANLNEDTSFVWMKSNPQNQLGANTIYMDLWADSTQTDWSYAFGANYSSGNFSERASSIFRTATMGLDDVIYDTLWNNSNRIATVEIYTEYVDQNLHKQFFFSHVDSTAYYFSLKAKGSGKFDAWTGSSHPSIKLTDMVSNIPNTSVYPPIVNYLLPDSLQTIVSSWNCSDKVISVGNVKNRIGHYDKNGNYYYANDNIAVGQLSKNSSKGPNRHNVIKPDVTASGDISFGSAPLWMINNSSYNAALDVNGWHVRNGGTSMASPCVAGIAALYLEKCERASSTSFRNDLINTSTADEFTGNIPNNAYGYGKPHALNLLLPNEFSISILGDTAMCADPILLSAVSDIPLSTAFWSNDSVGTVISIASPDTYWAKVINSKGCIAYSDTFIVTQRTGLPLLPITQIGNTLITSSFTANYQWTLNGTEIPGATNSTLTIYPPYGTYTCYSMSPEGCISETNPFTVTAGQEALTLNYPLIFPNPTESDIYFYVDGEINSVDFYDAFGRSVFPLRRNQTSWSLSYLSPGVYHVHIDVNGEKLHSKIIRR